MSKYRVDIQTELNNIQTTPYGKIMRPNLWSSLDKLARKQNALSDSFDSLIVDAGQNNSEVVDSRNDGVTPAQYNTLGERLDAMQQAIIDGDANNDAVWNEVTDAREDVDGLRHPQLKDRLDSDYNKLNNKFNSYLPLSGGTVTGDTVFEQNVNIKNGLLDNGNVTLTSQTNSFLLDINSFQRGNVEIGCPTGAAAEIKTSLPFIKFNKPLEGTGDIKTYNGAFISHNNGLELLMGVEADYCFLRNSQTNKDIRILNIGQMLYDGDIRANGSIVPHTDNGGSCGILANRWNAVYSSNGVIQTSSINRKSGIIDIDDNIFYDLIKNTGVHSYILNYPGMPENPSQDNPGINQENLHIGVIAEEMAQFKGHEYILNKYKTEDGLDDYCINNYNYTSAIHASSKVLIGKHEKLEHDFKTLNTKFNNEVKKRQALETIVSDLVKEIESLKGSTTTKSRKTSK